jgi:hypothetical protein
MGQLDSFYQLITSVLGKTAKKAVPKCHICGVNAVPFTCESCGRYACLEHVWVNAKRVEALCEECIEEAFGEEAPEEDDAPPGWNPFAVLGLHPEDATAETAKQAFRKKALKVHPDQGGSPEKFKELKRAFDAVMKLVGEEAER